MVNRTARDSQQHSATGQHFSPKQQGALSTDLRKPIITARLRAVIIANGLDPAAYHKVRVTPHESDD